MVDAAAALVLQRAPGADRRRAEGRPAAHRRPDPGLDAAHRGGPAAERRPGGGHPSRRRWCATRGSRPATACRRCCGTLVTDGPTDMCALYGPPGAADESHRRPQHATDALSFAIPIADAPANGRFRLVADNAARPLRVAGARPGHEAARDGQRAEERRSAGRRAVASAASRGCRSARIELLIGRGAQRPQTVRRGADAAHERAVRHRAHGPRACDRGRRATASRCASRWTRARSPRPRCASVRRPVLVALAVALRPRRAARCGRGGDRADEASRRAHGRAQHAGAELPVRRGDRLGGRRRRGAGDRPDRGHRAAARDPAGRVRQRERVPAHHQRPARRPTTWPSPRPPSRPSATGASTTPSPTCAPTRAC